MQETPPGPAAARAPRYRWPAAAFAALAVAAGAFFYLGSRTALDQAGRDLMEREMSMLSEESQSKPAPPAARPPALRPYGVLIVTGVPGHHSLLIDGELRRAGGEIHLPARRHLIEIRDARNRTVFRDSVAVGGGEPAVCDFGGRLGNP